MSLIRQKVNIISKPMFLLEGIFIGKFIFIYWCPHVWTIFWKEKKQEDIYLEVYKDGSIVCVFPFKVIHTKKFFPEL